MSRRQQDKTWIPVTRHTSDKEEIANFMENLPSDYVWVTPSPELEAWFDSLKKE